MNFDIIDYFEKVTDKEAAIAARRLAKEEGLLLGYSAGSAVQGLIQLKDRLSEDDVVVLIFHDHGSRYVGKLFNDDWMRDRGYLEEDIKVKDVLRDKEVTEFFSAAPDANLKSTLNMMKDNDISQLPVIKEGNIIGSITDTAILEHILQAPLSNSDDTVSKIMSDPFPEVNLDLPLNQLNKYISKENQAVIVKDNLGNHHIITQYDIIRTL